MKIFFIVLFIVHGLIHLFGFVKAFNLAQVNQLTQYISKPVGSLWLFVALLFILTTLLYYFEKDSWWIFGATAIIFSQILILFFWNDAKYGTIVNIILLLPIIVAFADNLPSSYEKHFKAEVENGLERYSRPDILTENDIKHLPSSVQKYIHNSGAVGKEKVQNFRAVFTGQIKPNPDSDFLDFDAVQYNFYDEPKRVFYIKSKMYGLPFEALHLYVNAAATMQVKISSLFQVVDAKGSEMNQSETVTMFNDMCFLAPASLIDEKIKWKEIDSVMVKATFTNQDNSISAYLFFNEDAQLINFTSNDRYESADGKIYRNYKWTTPLKNYKEFDGTILASYGEAIWHKPEGEYCYAKLNLLKIEYNCQEYK
jgi:hypothetical protein